MKNNKDTQISIDFDNYMMSLQARISIELHPGAPGPAYYQQRADYKINVELDDKNKKIYGDETITYTNNSPETLSYLWVQLDQNVRKRIHLV